MFGYVRPSDDRLTPADRETFRAAYCGLCHALGARYGLVGRYIRCGSAAVRQATRRWTRRRT